jgi:pimeloyl-ACP methyl ester carboxylesterase
VNIYFISGLGVDERVFQRLSLSPKFSIHHIEWIEPLYKEPIKDYAKRLSLSIDQNIPFALVGLSFGGMMAIEINQFKQPVKTIIISSAAIRSELPWFIRVLRFLPVYKFIPFRLLTKPNLLLYRLFGVRKKDERLLMKQILCDTDPLLLKWSIRAIANWTNETIPPNLIHIHGTADKILPINCVKADIIIEGGEHFMIYSKADEISAILNGLLNQPQL